jgi:hypothetical protein
MVAIICLVICSFGLGCIAASYVWFIKTRKAVPVWAGTHSDGKIAGQK